MKLKSFNKDNNIDEQGRRIISIKLYILTGKTKMSTFPGKSIRNKKTPPLPLTFDLFQRHFGHITI